MNSKSIGNNYERELSKKLSLWFTEGKSDDVCWRDLGSGNRSTIRKKQGKESIRDGDIVPTDLIYKPFFDKFHIDAKSLGSVHLMLINPNNMKSSQLLNEWIKVCEDAKKFSKIPLMFVKARNDRKIPEFIILDTMTSFYSASFIQYGVQRNFENTFTLVLLDDFFKNNKWNCFIDEN